jgi:hypothetical protein
VNRGDLFPRVGVQAPTLPLNVAKGTIQ